MAYTDDFNRSNGNLESAAASGGWSWVHDGLITGAMAVSSNALVSGTSSGTGSIYQTPDVGSANHYVQYKVPAATLTQDFSSSHVCCRLVDINNFIGIHVGSSSGNGKIEIASRVAGSWSTLYTSATGAAAADDVLRLECYATSWTLKKNGTVVTTGSINAALTGTRCGVYAHALTGAVADDFEAGILPAVVFTDDFNRSNENLEASGNWTKFGGSDTGHCFVSSNQLGMTSGGGEVTIGYQSPTCGTQDHYVQFTLSHVGTVSSGPFIACRFAALDAFVGVRYNGADLLVFARSPGLYTELSTTTRSVSSGDTIRLECEANNYRLFHNGTQVASGSIGNTGLNGTRCGLVPRITSINPWIDNYESGPLGADLIQSAEGFSATDETTVSFPNMPAAGNLIVLAMSGNDYHYLQHVDSGWFQATEAEYNQGVYVWWRIADGSTNSFTYTLDSTVRSQWILAEFSGVDQIDVAASRWAPESNATTIATPSLVPTTGRRLLIAYLAGSDGASNPSSDLDWTGWTNSFTHIRSKGYTSSTPVTMASLAYRFVTGDDSTAFSTAANLPSSKSTLVSYTEIAAFKEVGDKTADTAPDFRAVSSISYASRTNSVVNKPTGTVDGDIMLALFFHGMGGTAPPAHTPPSGWKLLLQDFPSVNEGTAFYARMFLYWKRASSEGSDYTWTHDSSNTQIAITAWSGCIASGSPIDSWTYNAAGNLKGSGRFGSICPNSTNYRFIAMDHNWSGSAESPISGAWTEHFDTTLLKIQSRAMTARGDSTPITRICNSPWEGYLVGLRGPETIPGTTVNVTGNSATVSVGTVTVNTTTGNAYEIDATAGSYAVTGQTVTLTKTTVYAITAAPSSYAVTGQTQTPKHGWRAAQTTTGSHVVTGSTATLTKLANLRITASASSYATTGQPQTLRRALKTFATTASSYVTTGVAANLIYDEAEAISVTVNVTGLSMLMFAGRAVWPGESGDGRQKEGQMLEMGRWMGH